ncbi:hypothetical protein PG987_005822 [Apiospora arundinis]
MHSQEEVSFRTLDGLTLRGSLYVGGHKVPAIIMTPGFNVTKEFLLPKVARYLQAQGITALVYDPRTVGASDGTPRNDINPAQQATDYHDALSFLKSDERVDPTRIAYWGVLLRWQLCPLTQWELSANRWRGVMAKAMQDRESQINGNSAFSIPMLTETGSSPAGFSSGVGTNELDLFNEAKERIPGLGLNTTIQTYYNIMAWSPFKCLRFLSPTPVLLISAEDDQISPAKDQEDLIFSKIDGPKQMYVVPKRSHMDALDGDSFESVMDTQIAFLREHLRCA